MWNADMAFSYGMRPWDVPRLTAGELKQIQEHQRARSEANG